jgi:hypothetical protein
MLVQGVANLTHLATTTLFPYTISDNALKRHKGLQETLAKKHNHLKDKQYGIGSSKCDTQRWGQF